MSEWQLIETAPKDGTRVDVWSAIGGRYSDALYVPERYTFGVPWGWSCQRVGRIRDVTHWMPLPSPPALTETDPLAQGN